MAKEEKTSVISDKTKIVLAIPQAVAVILFVLSVSGGFVSVGNKASSAVTTANEAKEISIEASKEIKQIKKDIDNKQDAIMKAINEIRESQIRMEGDLKLKQDRFNK
jgi:hypothetical protein